MKVVAFLGILFFSLTIALPSKNGIALNRQAVSGGPGGPIDMYNYTEGEKLLISCAIGCKGACNRQTYSSILPTRLHHSFKTCNKDFNPPMSRKGKKGKKSKKGKCKKGKCKSKGGKGGKGGKRCVSADKLMEKIAARSESKYYS